MPAPIHVFAARVHAHRLGKVITGYQFNPKTQSSELIIKGNPQWPQAFYPTTREFVLGEGDEVLIRCTYNSLGKSTKTNIGATINDEMCVVYFMYYSENVNGTFYPFCGFVCNEQQSKAFPADSIQPLPSNPILEAYALHGNKHNKSPLTELIVQKIHENSTTNVDQQNGQIFDQHVHQDEGQLEPVQPETHSDGSPPEDGSVESVEQIKQNEILENNLWFLLFFYRRFIS